MLLSPFKRYISELPSNCHQFVRQFNGFPVIGNGVPKAGTHLLDSVLSVFFDIKSDGSLLRYIRGFDLDETPFKKNRITSHIQHLRAYHYTMAHFTCEPFISELIEKRNAKMILIIRDPRDLILAHVKHALQNIEGDYRFHNYYTKILKNDSDRIMASISGVPGYHAEGKSNTALPNILERFNGFTEWFDDKNTLVVKFENLIGQRGGGTDMAQLQTLLEIRDFIGSTMTEKSLVQKSDSIFNPKSRTFNKGVINRWKTEFSKDHISKFKEVAGDLLINLGYEETNDW